MDLVVNGDARHFDGPLSVADLLRQYDLAPERVAVEVNEQLVKRQTFPDVHLQHGDRVEIVTLVGGG